MSGTLTVKELIAKLLRFDMDEPVYIELGGLSTNKPGARIVCVGPGMCSAQYGIHIVTLEYLVDITKYEEE